MKFVRLGHVGPKFIPDTFDAIRFTVQFENLIGDGRNYAFRNSALGHGAMKRLVPGRVLVGMAGLAGIGSDIAAGTPFTGGGQQERSLGFFEGIASFGPGFGGEAEREKEKERDPFRPGLGASQEEGQGADSGEQDCGKKDGFGCHSFLRRASEGCEYDGCGVRPGRPCAARRSGLEMDRKTRMQRIGADLMNVFLPGFELTASAQCIPWLSVDFLA